MTVTVTGTVRDVAGKPDRSKWVFTSVLRQSGDSGGSVVSTSRVIATPNVAGLLTVELDPGPVVVTYGNTTVAVTVPEDDADLWDLIGAAVNAPPPTSEQKLAAAIAAYLEAHPPTAGTVSWDDLDDMPAFIAAGATAAAARDAIGALDVVAVQSIISAVIDGAPGALDTLNELAAALGDDPNFAATVTTALANLSTQISGVDSSIRSDFTSALGDKLGKPAGFPDASKLIAGDGSLINPPNSGDLAVVTYAGNLGTSRPSRPVVYWVDFPSAPTNAQPQDIVAEALDSDLAAIAALTTTPFGRSLLTQTNAAAARRSVAAAGLHSPVPAYWPLRPYEQSPDVPTYASVDATTAGALTAYNAQPTKVLWNSTRLNKIGYVGGAYTLGGVATYPNVSAGRVSASDYSPKWTPPPHFLSVLFDGTVFRFSDVIADTNSLPFRLWVDGKYAGDFGMGALNGGSQRFHTLTFADARMRELLFEFPANFWPVGVGSPDTNASIALTPKLPLRLYMLGDSWVQGLGFTSTTTGNLDCMAALLAALTGWEVFNGGQSGTSPGTPAADGTTGIAALTWNSPQRMRAIADADPHVVLLHGTLNADGIASTTLPGFLTDLYAKVKAAAPLARIVHIGPQAQDPSSAGATRLANRDACATAAAAAGVDFIDPIAESWITGTGTWGSPSAGGNASLYYGGATGSDSSHMRDYEYYARRAVASVRNVLSS